MRISDWSSDVCSSDLVTAAIAAPLRRLFALDDGEGRIDVADVVTALRRVGGIERAAEVAGERSEERRVGKECGSTSRSRWQPYHYKKQKTDSKKHETEIMVKNTREA